jgi:uncharacterized protein with NAD-binding domain and iron-sulfur cluster
VEIRVHDEKAKLAGRLNTAETKVLQYDQMATDNQGLLAKVAELEREKALLQQKKLDSEHKYKDLDKEGKAFREGYNQLSVDNKTLQTEMVVLQTDYEEVVKQQKGRPSCCCSMKVDIVDSLTEVKQERDQLLEERNAVLETRNSAPSVIARPQIPCTTKFERRAADIQHLDSLVAVWKHTLDSATAKRDES